MDRKEEKEFIKKHFLCYGDPDSPLFCKCPLYHECLTESLKKIIELKRKP